jgi:ankyrin repeat protein
MRPLDKYAAEAFDKRMANERKARDIAALVQAIKQQNVSEVESLLRGRNIDVNVGMEPDINIPILMFAVRVDDTEGAPIVKALLTNGANPNVVADYELDKDIHGRSPLQLATILDDVGMVEQLLANGADVNYKEKGDKTALTLAKERSLKSIVDLLTTKGATTGGRRTRSRTRIRRRSVGKRNFKKSRRR